MRYVEGLAIILLKITENIILKFMNTLSETDRPGIIETILIECTVKLRPKFKLRIQKNSRE